MKAAFVHELKFLEDEDSRLYLRGYNQEYWDRYLKYFDQLYVVGRKTRASSTDVIGLDSFSSPKLQLFEIPSIHSPINVFTNWSNTISLMEELIKKVDCVITRQPGLYSNIVINLCKEYKKPYLIEMVGCPWDSFWNHSLFGKILAPILTLKTKNNLKNAQFVIYVTEKFLQRRYPTKGLSTNCSNVTLPNLTDDENLSARIRKINSLDKGKILLGTVGAVNVKYKGQQFVIKAISDLKKNGTSIYEYHLVGGGDQTYLKSIAHDFDVEDQVIFHGSMRHDDVFSFLDSIDLYVQPSLQEGLPRALIEAMSRGLPCFAAKTGGIPELLENEYIFSNSINRVKEIKSILTRFTKETMIKQAERNFKESKKFDVKLIEERREKMFCSFLKSINHDHELATLL